MNPDRLRVAAFIAVSVFVAGSVFSQEALDIQRPTPPAEEATPEESPAKETPKSKEKSTEKTQDQGKPAKGLEEVMRPEEFKSAGLDKLSEDELQHLDAWLHGYRQATEKKATEKAEAKASEEIKKATEEAQTASRQKLDSLVSRVDGQIEGLKGHTQIRLEDGSVWRQANADDHYRASVTDHPAAVILHTTFGYKMRIEGMPEFYVDPVVRPQ